jgi:hypothetical protein
MNSILILVVVRLVLINAILPTSFQVEIKELLVNWCDVFAWSYKDLKGIPMETCEHKIELMDDAKLIKKNKIEWIWIMHSK